MSTYAYEAVDHTGRTVRGLIDVASQSDALGRIKQMGFYPIDVIQRKEVQPTRSATARGQSVRAGVMQFRLRHASPA